MAAGSADAQRATQRLFEAIRANDVTAVQASLAAGADPDATDRWGVKPVDLAVDKGYYRIAHVLAAARQTARTEAAGGAKARSIVPAAVAATEAAPTAKAPARAGKPAAGSTLAKASPPAASQAAVAEPAPPPAPNPVTVAWPSGVPNPFDPSMPPPRSQLVITNDDGDAVQ